MNQPKLTIIDDPDEQLWAYQLLEDFELHWKGHAILVPAGFSYDGATIPSWAWQAIYSPFDPTMMMPALIHDWIYSNHQMTQEAADELLYDLIRQQRVPLAKAYAIWIAVRAVGDQWWPNSSKDLEYMRKLYQKVAGRPNFEKYHFPEEAMS